MKIKCHNTSNIEISHSMMTPYILLSLFLLLSILPLQTLFAQGNSTELSDNSTNQQLIKEIEEQLSILEDGVLSINAVSMIERAEKALHTSEEIGYQRGIIKANFVLGLSYHSIDNYKKSLQHYAAIKSNKESDKYPHYITLMHQGKG